MLPWHSKLTVRYQLYIKFYKSQQQYRQFGTNNYNIEKKKRTDDFVHRTLNKKKILTVDKENV